MKILCNWKSIFIMYGLRITARYNYFESIFLNNAQPNFYTLL